MATLFGRISGQGTDENNRKIPLHIFSALLNELADGRVTPTMIVNILGLDAAQTTDAAWLRDCINTAPEKNKMKRVIKDMFYLSEWPGTRDHVDEDYFEQRVLDEFEAQGGVAPARG